MKASVCPICRIGVLSPGVTTLTFERDGHAFAITGVPAEVCDNCGEAVVDAEIAVRVSRQAEAAFRRGKGAPPIAYEAA